MASSSSSPPSSGFCISSGRFSFQPRIFPDTLELKLYTEGTYPGGLIFEAAREGNIPIMKDLARVCRIEDRSLEVVEEIKVKGSPNGTSLGALHVAASNGKLEMCEFLIDQLNLDVDAAAEHGQYLCLRQTNSADTWFLENGC
ncbi:hypothetical protein QYE76_004218 [Lolium multiflorum]|uniref:Uncharacterized protein n=1 Tax=Lolium multiflorum TaxID=4521 RepID=A0AAD8RRL0_LOLMU|nr:hypothetical protein QYE76_004218 [Lolium multiflorum]